MVKKPRSFLSTISVHAFGKLPGMTWISVSSKAIRAVGYDGYTLAVQFRRSGQTYLHPGVPGDVFHDLLNASSKGNFYSKHIRGRYR